MKQFLIKPSLTSTIEICGKDYHYLKNVRRFKSGDRFPGVDRDGSIYNLLVLEEREDSLILECTPCMQEDHGKKNREIILYQCLLKGKKMDNVVRQATEGGVTSIVPVESAHSIVKIKDINSKIERWERIIREALQQSGNQKVPCIESPVKAKEIIFSEGVNLFFHQVEIGGQSLHNCLAGNPEKVSILIGPEGGFSPEETKLFQSKGAIPVFLGPFVLRAETAALYSLGAVQTILIEHTQWRLH